MPVGHPLDALDAHDLPDAARVDQLLDGLEKHGVAQHVADDHMEALFLRQLGDVAALGDGAGGGLFQQQVIAQIQRVDGGLIVHVVGGADAHHVRQTGLLEHAFHAVEAHFRRNMVPLGGDGHAVGLDVRHGD